MKTAMGFILFLPMLLTANAFGQEIKKEFIDPRPQEASSAAVKVKGGSMIFLAGHTASLPERDAALGNLETQVKRTFDKIKNTLDKAGGTLDDIVSLSVYMTDLRYIPDFTRITKGLFKKGYPAITFAEVSHLARPELLLEIQPIAVIP